MSTMMIFVDDTVKGNMTNTEFLAKSNTEVEITLSEDITLSDSLKVDDKNCTIDLNEHTLMFTKDTNISVNNANVIFKNGIINLDGIKGSADCIQWKLTKYKKQFCFKWRKWNSLSGRVIKTSNGKYGKINIANSTLNFENAQRGFVDGTINIKDFIVNMKGLDNGINGSDFTVDNSKLTITKCIGRALTIDGKNVNVKNNSVLDFSNSLEGDIRFKSEGNVIKECKYSKDFIITNAKYATCTEEGYTGDEVCPNCNEVIEKGTIISVLDHKFENGTCTHCGELDPNFKPNDTEKPGNSEVPDVEVSGNTE